VFSVAAGGATPALSVREEVGGDILGLREMVGCLIPVGAGPVGEDGAAEPFLGAAIPQNNRFRA
jgi:hypothetical protein